MKARAPGQSKHVFHVYHARWLSLLALSLICTGCFAPRNQSAWPDANSSAERYGILPVFPAQVRITVESANADDPYGIAMASKNVKNQAEVARIINDVLDTIADSENNALEGPGKVDAALKLSPNWKNFQVYVQDPGPFYERWKRQGLSTISRDLGYQRVLYVSPTLRFTPNLSIRAHENDPLGHHWAGRLAVAVDLMDLATTQVVDRGAGEADFYGDIGVVALGGYGAAVVIPYAFGKAFDRAVDQAIRQAFAELFTDPLQQGATQ